MKNKCVAYFIFSCFFTLITPSLACALDEHPRKDERDTIRAMCEAPWDNVDYFKRRFPEAFKEATKCTKYMCSGMNTPSINHITDRTAFEFDIVLCKSIIIAAKPGGLEEQIYRLDKEGIKAMKAGDRNKANEVISRQRQLKKENGLN